VCKNKLEKKSGPVEKLTKQKRFFAALLFLFLTENPGISNC